LNTGQLVMRKFASWTDKKVEFKKSLHTANRVSNLSIYKIFS